MNFRLTQEQAALQDAVRRFLEDALGGGRRRTMFEEAGDFDAGFWKDLAGLGLVGMMIDEAHGGLGLGLVELALVAEAMGHEAAPGPFLGHALGALAIAHAGSCEQKARWLPKLASGQAIATVALAEQGDRWAPDEWRLSIRNGTLTGRKAHVLYPLAADVLVVGLQGGGLALVERDDARVECTALDGSDRTRRLWSVRFDQTPADALDAVDSPGATLMNHACVLLAADAFGGATRCLNMTVDYVRTRTQFGSPVGRFQGVKHRLANLATEIEPARGLYWYAALAQDQQLPGFARVASLAKAHLAERFNDAARTSVELHGGIGFTWEYELQIWVKRAMFDFAFAGTPARHRRWAMLADPIGNFAQA